MNICALLEIFDVSVEILSGSIEKLSDVWYNYNDDYNIIT